MYAGSEVQRSAQHLSNIRAGSVQLSVQLSCNKHLKVARKVAHYCSGRFANLMLTTHVLFAGGNTSPHIEQEHSRKPSVLSCVRRSPSKLWHISLKRTVKQLGTDQLPPVDHRLSITLNAGAVHAGADCGRQSLMNAGAVHGGADCGR